MTLNNLASVVKQETSLSSINGEGGCLCGNETVLRDSIAENFRYNSVSANLLHLLHVIVETILIMFLRQLVANFLPVPKSNTN